MAARSWTFQFARVNFIGQLEKKKEILTNAFTSNHTEQYRNFKYGFFDFESLGSEVDEYAFGRLVKFKSILEAEIVDEEAHELVQGGIEEGVVAKADFILHFNSGVLAYHPISNRLSAFQFRRMFGTLVEVSQEAFFIDVEVETIEEDYDIQDVIGKFDFIRSINLTLHPTNPSNRIIYRKIDERLKSLNAETLTQYLEAGEGGLNQDSLAEDDLGRGLIMAADGYGKGKVEGTVDGNKVVISTDDSPIVKDVIPSENSQELLAQLRSTFERIWSRKNADN